MSKELDKKKYICGKAYDELIKNGINQFSLNKFISMIDMSKGQFYYYFKTKEELICKVIDTKCYEMFNYKYEQTKLKTNFLDKLSMFFSFFIEEKDPEFIELAKLLKSTFHLYINTENGDIQKLNRNFYYLLLKYIEEMIDELIKKDCLKENAKKFPRSILATVDGMYLHSLMDTNFNFKHYFSEYLLAINELLIKHNKGDI
ncbi:TetR/AcrR family transcriptional regulator [Poseidonibacter lekithochrous]|uniref:TetR/AcrR family transcriptional regulator n=1 Tax=Poseidonibacter TaxID=2321187 RepID=UPI001C07F943|nr:MULTISPECIES: TetR/AcrR family transcriptional regulator [Poseidonibacter]MBU3015932.1 TetR/AcrR family transcriptional regulator [Poseidonibacter lekithochrous]MDO6829231.1 TetR/AcrR family transcriptional regulator [Poseidonibacter sp. 1_MG-2023]